MADEFLNHPDRLDSPARNVFAITPHATNALTDVPKAILIGGDGDVTLRPVDSDTDVTIPVLKGQILPIRASHVRLAGTTATPLFGLA